MLGLLLVLGAEVGAAAGAAGAATEASAALDSVFLGGMVIGLKAEDVLLKMQLDERATIERLENAGFGVSKVEVGSWTEKQKTRRWAGCRAREGKIGCLYTEAGSPGATE